MDALDEALRFRNFERLGAELEVLYQGIQPARGVSLRLEKI